MPAQITFEVVSKIGRHVAAYPSSPLIAGFLLCPAASSTSGESLEINVNAFDVLSLALPAFHSGLPLAPVWELACIQLEQFCAWKKHRVAGVYYSDLAQGPAPPPPPPASLISLCSKLNLLSGNSSNSNERCRLYRLDVTTLLDPAETAIPSLKLYDTGTNKWSPTADIHIPPAYKTKFAENMKNAVYPDSCSGNKTFLVTDFEAHLDDCSRNWLQ